MFAAAKRPLTIHEVRRALIGTADPHPGPSGRTSTQLGYGYLNTAAAVAAARRIGLERRDHPAPAAQPAEEHEQEVVTDDVGWAPVWVEEAADGVEFDEAPFTEPAIVTTEVGEISHEATSGERACGRHESVKEERVSEDESDEKGDAEGDPFGEFDTVEEEIATPFTWEDVQEALAAVEEIEG
jgi:hypothetical protein